MAFSQHFDLGVFSGPPIARMGQGGGFSPANMTGAHAWYKADGAGSTLSVMPDLTGNGHDGQAGGPGAPTFTTVNGRQAYDLTNSRIDILQGTGFWDFGAGSDVTVILAGGGDPAGEFLTDAQINIFALRGGGGTFRPIFSSAELPVSPAVDPSGEGIFVFRLRSGGRIDVNFGGSSVAGSAAGAGTFAPVARTYRFFNNIDGPFCEAIVLKGIPPLSEINEAGQYLSARWGYAWQDIPVFETLPLPHGFGVTLQRSGGAYSVAETIADFRAQYSGATRTVNPAGGADHTTIDAAIAAASDGDVIELAPGVHATPTTNIAKSVRIMSTGSAYIGAFDNLQTATITSSSFGVTGGGTVTGYTVNDVTPGETFVGFIRTDGVKVSGLTGGAEKGSIAVAADEASLYGAMCVYPQATDAVFFTGNGDDLQALVDAGHILAFSDASTTSIKVVSPAQVLIDDNISIASNANGLNGSIEVQANARLILGNGGVYGGQIRAQGGYLTLFETMVSGSGDNIGYFGDAIGAEVSVTSKWCNDASSANASTTHNTSKVLRVNGEYRGGGRVIHDIDDTENFLFGGTYGDALYSPQSLIEVGGGSNQTTTYYGGLTFDGVRANDVLVNSGSSTATEILADDPWPWAEPAAPSGLTFADIASVREIYDARDDAALTRYGAQIAAFADSQGAGGTFAAPFAAMPSLVASVNNYPALRFNGETQYMQHGSPSMAAAVGEVNMLAVVSGNTSTASYIFTEADQSDFLGASAPFWSRDSAGGGDWGGFWKNGSPSMFMFDVNSFQPGQTAVTLITITDTQVISIYNGEAAVTQAWTRPSGSSVDVALLGALRDSSGLRDFCDIDVHAIAQFGALTAAEKDQVVGIAAHGFGAQGNLPPGHPYRNAPPS